MAVLPGRDLHRPQGKSGALPGRTHDLTAARAWGILRELDKTGIITPADNAHALEDLEFLVGGGVVDVDLHEEAVALGFGGRRGVSRRRGLHRLHPVQETRQARVLQAGQPLARHAPWTRRTRKRPVKSRRILRRLRCSPSKADHLVKAIASYRTTSSPE